MPSTDRWDLELWLHHWTSKHRAPRCGGSWKLLSWTWTQKASQCASLRHSRTSISIPKRVTQVCREALFSLVTPGHLLSLGLFLDYRHLVEYILYAQSTPPTRRDNFVSLWNRTRHYRWGPFRRPLNASKSLGPWAFMLKTRLFSFFPHTAISIDEPLPTVNISYATLTGNFYYITPCKDGLTVQVQLTQSTWNLHVNSFYLPHNPCINRWCVTFSHGHLTTLDASLNPTFQPLATPFCIHCNQDEEIAKHRFWECRAWQQIWNKYSSHSTFGSPIVLSSP